MYPPRLLTPQAVFAATHSQVSAFSTEDGRPLWQAPASGNYHKGPDLFVVGGTVWTGQLAGYNAQSGDLVRRLEQRMDQPMGHDHCYRNFITEQYTRFMPERSARAAIRPHPP